MNDFMSQYNSRIANLRQNYNTELQKLQNEAKQYSESLRLHMQNPFQHPTPNQPILTNTTSTQESTSIPANTQSTKDNSIPINVQILAVLGDIKGRLDKAFPDKEKQNITSEEVIANTISEPELPLTIKEEKTATKEDVKSVNK